MVATVKAKFEPTTVEKEQEYYSITITAQFPVTDEFTDVKEIYDLLEEFILPNIAILGHGQVTQYFKVTETTLNLYLNNLIPNKALMWINKDDGEPMTLKKQQELELIVNEDEGSE